MRLQPGTSIISYYYACDTNDSQHAAFDAIDFIDITLIAIFSSNN